MTDYRLTASFYDFILYPVLHPIRKKEVEVAKRLKPASIIDICCGTGDQLK